MAALTGAHTIVGTPQYMAPEQIEGREADARSDIFAFGCVLYELLTGQRAFDGKTVSNVMAATLATEPRKMTDLVPMTPLALEWVVRRCLEKDPDARWQSVADVALQLRWLAEQSGLEDRGAAQAPRSRRHWLGGVALGVVLAGIAAGVWGWMRPAVERGRVVGSSIALPEGLAFKVASEAPAVAVSPDGETLVFSLSDANGDSALYVRPFGSFGLTRIAGSERVVGGVVMSPDGQWLAFQRGQQAVKLPVSGGVAVPICAVQQLRGLACLSNDELIVAPNATSGLMRVKAGSLAGDLGIAEAVDKPHMLAVMHLPKSVFTTSR